MFHASCFVALCFAFRFVFLRFDLCFYSLLSVSLSGLDLLSGILTPRSIKKAELQRDLAHALAAILLFSFKFC